MKTTYLDFEQPVAELESKIEQLRYVQGESAVDIAEEIDRLRSKCDSKLKDLYDKLTPWQTAMVARHPQRPYTLDYIHALMTDFHELHGDRAFADDPAIVGGVARFDGRSVVVIGHQKGRDAKERTHRNFGMPRPEGYRKALRLMKLAEKFGLPIITLIDTPGAFPGMGAEERGQSEAIGRNLLEMAALEVPIISIVIGEGGSGGALALGAAILWKSAEKASEAAEIMGITAPRLKALGLIDEIIDEPVGGAHRDMNAMVAKLRPAIAEALRQLSGMRRADLVRQRQSRIAAYGKFKEVTA